MTRPQLTDEQINARFPKKKPAAPAAQVLDAGINQERMAADMALMREQQGALTVAKKEQNERVTALALQLNYNGSTDPAVLENSAQDAIRRMGMTIFELGGYLLLLKEASPRGQFLPALERLGIVPVTAQRYMSVTRRFANASSGTHLEKAGIKKLVELLPLDDEQLEDLTELGQTGELALDDLGGMSVKELRTAVRKARAEADKLKARAERQEAVNAELHEEVRLVKRLPPAEELKRTLKEAADIQAEVMGLLQGGVRQALAKLNTCEQDQSLYMAGMVGQLLAELAVLRDEFNLPELETTPEWERWNAAQGAIPASASKAN